MKTCLLVGLNRLRFKHPASCFIGQVRLLAILQIRGPAALILRTNLSFKGEMTQIPYFRTSLKVEMQIRKSVKLHLSRVWGAINEERGS